ncbi:MAG: trigger factor [Bacteroidota bacterium]
MNVTFDKKDALNGTISVNISGTDYSKEIDNKLKDFQKRANIPGFRPGMAPKGMIEKMYGTTVLLEAINSTASKGLFDYIEEHKLNILGQPVLTEDTKVDELKNGNDYTFKFDIGLAPEFNLDISDKDVFTKLKVVIDEKQIDEEVERMQKRFGNLTEVEKTTEDDIVYTTMTELDDDGNVIEGGVYSDSTPMLIQSIKNEAIKNEFLGSEKGKSFDVNVFDMFDNSESEMSHALNIDKLTVADISKNFRVTVKEIKRNEKADVNQDLFDKAYGEGTVSSMEEMRARIKSELETYFSGQADHLLEHEMIDSLVAKQNIELPDEFLKRWLIDRHADKFNADNVNDNYGNEARYLKNHLFEEKVLGDAGVKVEEEDIKAAALNYTRSMFGAYGTQGLSDEMLESIIEPSMKKEDYRSKMINLAVSQKVRDVIKSKVKVEDKEVTSEEFFKLVAEHNEGHHH